MSADASMASMQMWRSCSLADIAPGPPEQGEVHLRLLPLGQPASIVEELATLLSPDEHERASRFHFDRDRNHFIVARGALRQMLGRYAGLPASAIRFLYGPFGKPYLAESVGQAKLEFSLAHSGDWALAGFSQGRMIGVDLEKVRALADYHELAQSNFAPAEAGSLLELPEERQLDGFFACWTRKEAYVKALGLGLSLDLSSFLVSVNPCEGVEMIPASETAKSHHLQGLNPVDGYWAAAAVEITTAPSDIPKMLFWKHSELAA